MRTCVALRHVAFEDLGAFAPVLESMGYRTRYVEAGLDDFAAIDPLADDLMVVLGGPIGAYEGAPYPFLAPEIDLVARRLRSGKPVVGICLGAQLMATALGARVHPNPAGKEIGWAPLDLTEEGRHVLPELAGVPVLHWHGDTFELPEGARLLASTPTTPNQAFAWGGAALGLQFHVEVSRAGLERWYIGHACEIAATSGVDVPSLRADAVRYGRSLEEAGGRLLARWLAETRS